MAKRLYKDEYLNLGFAYISQHGIIKPQCVVCAEVLSNESFKHNKLKRHLESKHSRLVNKQRSFFEEEEQKLKRQRLDVPTNTVVMRLQQATLASYLVAWRIVRAKKPHNIGEELLNPAALDMVRTV